MCQELDSSPPIAAGAGATLARDEAVREGANGDRFAATAAKPEPAGVDRSAA